MSNQTYQNKYPLEKRKDDSRGIRERYPDRIPVIVYVEEKSEIPKLDKIKYLIYPEMTVSQFMYILRNKVHIPPEKAIFAFVGNTIPSPSEVFGNLDKSYRDEDGFLYVKIASETTFG